jgi:hypothetical protein
MIILAQLTWVVRVVANRKLGSYLRGLGGALLLAPAMVRKRATLRASWRDSRQRFWQEILKSEALARNDFIGGQAEPTSTFLAWYFRLF